MNERDTGEIIRGAFPGEPVFELEPLLRALENEGKIHPIGCEEAIKSVLLDLKNHGIRESFSESWNVVSHVEECSSLACSSLRSPNHLTKYDYPTEKEYIVIEKRTREAFIRDKAEYGIGRAEAVALFETLRPA